MQEEHDKFVPNIDCFFGCWSASEYADAVVISYFRCFVAEKNLWLENVFNFLGFLKLIDVAGVEIDTE